MRKTSIALGLIAAISTAPAMAAVATGNLNVKANVVASCAVKTNTAASGDATLDFGQIDSTKLNTNIDADTSTTGGAKLSVTCTNGTSYTVIAGLGNNSVSGQRNMKSTGADLIAYNLYTTSARTTVFPTTPAAATPVTGTGTTQTYDIFGRIPTLTTLPAVGAYTDTVLMTVTY